MLWGNVASIFFLKNWAFPSSVKVNCLCKVSFSLQTFLLLVLKLWYSVNNSSFSLFLPHLYNADLNATYYCNVLIAEYLWHLENTEQIMKEGTFMNSLVPQERQLVQANITKIRNSHPQALVQLSWSYSYLYIYLHSLLSRPLLMPSSLKVMNIFKNKNIRSFHISYNHLTCYSCYVKKSLLCLLWFYVPVLRIKIKKLNPSGRNNIRKCSLICFHCAIHMANWNWWKTSEQIRIEN